MLHVYAEITVRTKSLELYAALLVPASSSGAEWRPLVWFRPCPQWLFGASVRVADVGCPAQHRPGSFDIGALSLSQQSEEEPRIGNENT